MRAAPVDERTRLIETSATEARYAKIDAVLVVLALLVIAQLGVGAGLKYCNCSQKINDAGTITFAFAILFVACLGTGMFVYSAVCRRGGSDT